jgi:hypothetical protein
MANRNQDGITSKPKDPLYQTGAKMQTVDVIASVLAADNDGDTIVLAQNLPVDTRILGLWVYNAIGAITGATDYDIGIYRSDELTPIDEDVLVDGIDLSSGVAAGDILGTNIGSFDKTATIAELLGIDASEGPRGGVSIVVTQNVAGTADGDINMRILLDMAD